MFHTKTEDELSKLNDRNLLAYYRAERSRYYSGVSAYICGCCGEYYWDLYKDYGSLGLKFKNWQDYLFLVKSLLSKRSHVIKK